MRTRNEIRENGFVVARQYLTDHGRHNRPIGPVYQLHLDAIDMLAELAEKDAEIELWKTADSKAVAAARRQIDKLWEALEGAWHQFAYVDGNGKRWCGGLSALEDMADALGLDV